MKVSEISNALNCIAPNYLAQSWDNTGLLIGDKNSKVKKVLFCIDLTDAVLDEAIKSGAEMVMAYHPIIFKPIGKVTADYSSIIFKAIRNNIAVYSTHTAWDSVPGGANDILADRLTMSKKRSALEPVISTDAYKIVVFAPDDDLDQIQRASFAAGAGIYGADAQYTECGFAAGGTGTFFPSENANPSVGKKGSRQSVAEKRWETICPKGRISAVIDAIYDAHSYEQPAIDIIELNNLSACCGIGRAGKLQTGIYYKELLELIKRNCSVDKVLVFGDKNISARRRVNKIAVGCGSCGSLYKNAAASGCEVFVTGEMRHHDGLAAAAAGITVICTGHSNSERLTLRPMAKMLKKHCPEIKTVISKTDKDPMVIA